MTPSYITIEVPLPCPSRARLGPSHATSRYTCDVFTGLKASGDFRPLNSREIGDHIGIPRAAVLHCPV